MDFITKLSLSKDLIIKVKYDSILIIMDRLTKYVYLLSYIKALNAIDLTYIFLHHIIIDHRTLELIIFNRDKLFTSKF
jgi:hypothetical protein